VAASASPRASAAPVAGSFTLASTAFEAGGAIPRRFTCDGEDVSPDLTWSGAPDGTAALVLTVDDPDARDFVHWIAYNLPGSGSGTLPLGVSTAATAPPQGVNDFGREGWGGPCPPSGEHRYRFTLSALAEPLELQDAPTAVMVRDAMAGATVLGQAKLEGRYRRR